jgi:phosphoribosylformimino-5-aminoimidazole carboxamide ribotide isomerase
MVKTYGDRIAVGADIKDGKVAIKGWVEKSEYSTFEFFEKLQRIGVSTVICTDISKDGAMQGTNRQLYKELSEKFNVNIIASGGVSSLDDIRALNEMDLFGAIIGKAYYTGAVKISDALEVVK